MGKKRQNSEQPDHYIPIDEESQRRELQALAFQSLRQRLIDGTATSGEILYAVKYDPDNDGLHKQLLEDQSALMKAKVVNLEAQANSEETLKKAIEAFTSYRGTDD